MAEFAYERCLREPILSPELTRPFAEQGRDQNKLWLDKNENVDPELLQFVEQTLAQLGPKALTTYPDCYQLYQQIAEYEQVSPESLLLTAGSDGAIRTVFEACINPGDKVIHTDPTFAMYYVYSKMFGAEQVLATYSPSDEGPQLTVETLIGLINEHQPKLVCLANPDSPTGTVYQPEDLQRIIACAQAQNALILIDEAYYPFYQHSALPWINQYPNLLVARTFAKAWGLAGLRVGYLAANPALSCYMHKVKPMYEVNTVALRFMEAMLAHTEEMQASVQRLLAGKGYFVQQMREMGYKVLPTEANFVHVCFAADEAKIHAFLEDKVLYRKGFAQACLAGYTRFTVATQAVSEQMVTLIKQAREQHHGE